MLGMAGIEMKMKGAHYPNKNEQSIDLHKQSSSAFPPQIASTKRQFLR